ncbi:MAG: hypothetical protein LQ349_006659, partial [Xanthoria aureola]
MKIYYHDNEPVCRSRPSFLLPPPLIIIFQSDSSLPHATSPTLPPSILAPLGILYDFCPPNDVAESSSRDKFGDAPSSADAADFSKD